MSQRSQFVGAIYILGVPGCEVKKPSVLLSIPTYDGRVYMQTFDAIMEASAAGSLMGRQFLKSSLLTKGFNQLWCAALNQRENFTHFCMLHADILPDAGWLDKMLGIMAEHKADVLSAVMPMKSQHGLTSTAIETGDLFKPARFTMKQVATMPETFTHPKLLINTGLMLVDFTKEWVEDITFSVHDQIRLVNGNFEAFALSEDWEFSVAARQQGAKLFATRAVKARHMGEFGYPNQGAWGELESDIYNGEAKL